MRPGCPTSPTARWRASDPYDPAAHVHTSLRACVRYLNVGTENYPFHPHGNNGMVIGRDGHALEGPGGQDLSFEKFAINIGPGQTWDVIFKWYDAEGYRSRRTDPGPGDRSGASRTLNRHVLQRQPVPGGDRG